MIVLIIFVLPPSEDVGVKDGANNNYASHYPQEILDLNWQNTSEQKVKEAYKIWADTYDKVGAKCCLFKSFVLHCLEEHVNSANPARYFLGYHVLGQVLEQSVWRLHGLVGPC